MSRSFVPLWIVGLFVIGAFLFVERQSRTIHEQETRASVQETTSLIRSRLEGTVNANVELVRGIVAVLSTRTDISQDEFSALVSRAIGDRDEFINIAVAPSLVVTLVHPYAPNAAVVGLDYNDNPAQRAAALKVRDTGQIVFAGPVDLVQGGRGFIGRFPVFVERAGGEDFWGIVSAVIDVTRFYDAAGLNDLDTDVRVALRGKDGTSAEGDVFYGDPAIFEASPVLTEIVLPEGSWQLAVVPAKGWAATPGNIWTLRALMIAIAIGVIVPTFLMCMISAHRDEIIRILRAQEATLRDQRKELQQLSIVAQSASDSIVLSDTDGRIKWVNDAFTEITGYAAEEAVGRTPAELLNGPETDLDTVREISDHIRRGERFRTEILNYTKAKRKIWIETYLVPVRDEAGTVTLIAAIERDITKSKHHAEELARAKEQAEKADRAKSEFIANMSHEIRTPMNGIIGMAEVLAESDLPSDAKGQVRIVQDSAQSLLQIINDVLDISRLESGKFEIAARDFNLRACIDSAVGLVRAAAHGKGLEIIVMVADNLPEVVHADDGRLRQILLNLLGNAVKFTAEGEITLRVRASGHAPCRLIFEVEDTGIGLSQEHMSRIFDRFSQADAGTTRKFGGTGLGLSIARRLAELMGGSISVTSELGKGSCFVAEICAETPEHPNGSIAANSLCDTSVLFGRRLLLVEDNSTNRFLAHKFLEDIGLEIWDAEDGEEALDVFKKVRPDIVLMDMSMPKLDGLEATRQIRAMPQAQPTIIALTANAFESDRQACLRAGMDDFLTKPLQKQVLIETLVLQYVKQNSPTEILYRA